jgi:hypothetical protein
VSSEKIAVCAPISNRDGMIGEAKEDETVLQAFQKASKPHLNYSNVASVLRICEGENVDYYLQDHKAAFQQQVRLPRILLCVPTFLFHSS